MEEITPEELEISDRSAVFLADSKNVREMLELADISYEGEISLKEVEFCKLETQPECMVGSLAVPRILDVLVHKFRMMYFINQKHIVIVDDDHFAERIIERVRRKRVKQGQTKEKFIYNFLTEMISRILHRFGGNF